MIDMNMMIEIYTIYEKSTDVCSIMWLFRVLSHLNNHTKLHCTSLIEMD